MPAWGAKYGLLPRPSPPGPSGCCFAGVAYVIAFTILMNYLAYLALKFYSGQQPRASVSAAEFLKLASFQCGTCRSGPLLFLLTGMGSTWIAGVVCWTAHATGTKADCCT